MKRIKILTERIDFSLLDRKEFDYVTLSAPGLPGSSAYGVLWPTTRIDKFSMERETIDIKLKNGSFIIVGFEDITNIELTNRGLLITVGQEYKITLE